MARDELSDVLSEFAQTMVTNFPIQKILDHLVKRIVDIMPITSAGVTLIAPGLQPRYVAASDESALRFEMLQTELGEGPCLATYNTGEAIAVANLNGENRFPRFTPRALEAGLTAVFTFPLRHEDVRLGALDLYRGTAGALTEELMSTAQTLADVAAAYLINAQARADLQDSSDQSREAALHDALTGLPNRVLLLQLLAHAFRGARRSGKSSAVFFVDLDQFKEINDTHGHQVGDELLVAVADRLTGLLRPGDSLARLSGDEFVILCEELDDPSQADPIAVRLDTELSRPFVLARMEVNITASIGIAFTGNGNDVPEDLLHDADLAMYRSKHDGARAAGVLDLRELHLAGHQAGLASGLRGAEGRGELHINTSRSSALSMAASPESRRCCGGRTQIVGSCHRPCSFPSPNSPARSSSWGVGCSTGPGQTITPGRLPTLRTSECRSTSPRTSSCPLASWPPSRQCSTVRRLTPRY